MLVKNFVELVLEHLIDRVCLHLFLCFFVNLDI